ncbi:hypothetical protein [Gordonia sp. (in: high G+C Gram-positive bacteria)]|uniref:hypothetical protein n=1 Tax=Gordonia sp. (in: high G+C Gram-positive bacteria) TaxID=84139 RepID=UPI0035293688
MAGEVRSEADVWRLRAAAAEDAARELEGLAADLHGVLTRNYFGLDCVEGEILYSRLLSIVDGAASGFLSTTGDLNLLAARCKSAAEAFDAADEPGTHGM